VCSGWSAIPATPSCPIFISRSPPGRPPWHRTACPTRSATFKLPARFPALPPSTNRKQTAARSRSRRSRHPGALKTHCRWINTSSVSDQLTKPQAPGAQKSVTEGGSRVGFPREALRMRIRGFLGIVLGIIALMAMAARPAGAQSITCSSDNGKRNFCPVDTRGGVQMVRQRSGSPCQQGSTWGFDRRGIWVDRGCRADFVVRSGGGYRPGRPGGPGYGPGGPGGGQSITCSSDNGRRNFCAADTRRGVQMVRQRSDARCIQGSTWGYDRRGIWVDRGCRADFIVR
jgi:hypothetical protein